LPSGLVSEKRTQMNLAKRLLSTGEAARLLHISRSTVSRKFDQGYLHGRTHPVTGKREICHESVVAFMRQYHLEGQELEASRRNILVASPVRSVSSAIDEAVGHDERLSVDYASSGCSAILSCAKRRYDLFILDDAIEDVSQEALVGAFRASGVTKSTPVLRWARREARAPLNGNVEFALRAEETQPQCIREILFSLLALPPEPEPDTNTFAHRRRWPRLSVDIPATLKVYLVAKPRKQSAGEAIIRNISRGGALLSDIRMDNGKLPLEPFRVVVATDHPPLSRWRAHGHVVRLRSEGKISIGVQFLKISQPCMRQIAALDAI